MPMFNLPVVSSTELLAELQSTVPPRLLDVREAYELEISRLPDLVHIPLGELADAIGGLDKDADWVVVCRSGMRSAQATDFLLGHGFTHVRNLTGGMNLYAQTADTSLAVY